MSHLNPGGDTRPVPPLLCASAAPGQSQLLGIDCFCIRDAIAVRRARIGAIELEWIAACESNAARGAGHGIRLDDRETWDKAAWGLYLAAAAASEPDYVPQLRRLYDEIGRLERLLTALTAATRWAA